ncbi:Toxin ParE4 (plasmid) [Roseovarius sp. THAF9]|uniref:type II toxin-antitoxin system RelE/ParE family toxin n=1 Tax=Roseovarius sp. THAF9 TaxID=2587847 RepID=UPI001267F4B2|nr:type II toxin-antitoxin system RelE/ParE family toxin [Roseovarius sp. THAF9]QFT95206.1 Toxin ParE4 [Roseovarius sp. THAF9]
MPASNLIAYQLTPAAQRDLEDIWLYTAQTWSMAQADRYTDIMEDTFDRLLFMPEMARERQEFNPPVRIHPIAEHLIIYQVERDQLVILRVLGAGQDWHAILRAADQ